MSHTTRVVSWLLLVLLVGGHWGVLQVVAWTGMFIDHSRDNSVADALEMTFGGDHRCAICKQVDEGIAADLGGAERKAPGKMQKTVKVDAVVEVVAVLIPATTGGSFPATAVGRTHAGWRGEPPRRPPQTVG